MKRKTIRGLAILVILLAVRCLLGIFFVRRGFAQAIAQGSYLCLAVILGLVGCALVKKGWGEMEDPNFSPRQKIAIGTLAVLLLSVVAVYWLGFYVVGGEGDLAGVDYRVAHTDLKGNVHLDFTQSDAWAVDWSNLSFEDWLSVAYRSGEFTGGAQAVRCRLYVKNFFGEYEYIEHDNTISPGNGFSSRLREGPFITYRLLFEREAPGLTEAKLYVTGGTLDPGW